MQDVTIETLLSIKTDGRFDCKDSVEREPKATDAIGGVYVPDHRVICEIPENLLRPGLEREVRVQIHIIWLKTDTAYKYAGLVADKLDCKIYYAEVTPDDADSIGSCRFTPADEQGIQNIAKKHNPYLQDIINLSHEDKRQLLDYQVYSHFSERFCYVEMPKKDRVVLYGVGLHDNRFWSVGWLGKLIIKDLVVIYAESSLEAYEQFKREVPSLYDRCRKLERYQHILNCFHVICEKRKKHPEFAQILTTCTEQPMGEQQISCIFAQSKGTYMKEYNGPAPHWIESFAAECQRQFSNRQNHQYQE